MDLRDDTPIDGRRARRERSRQAVVDAAFGLILDGKGPPSAEDVAERAGVSVSSIFRNFDGLSDLQQQAVDQFQERYAHLLDPAPDEGVDRGQRVAFLIDHRLDLYEQASPLMALARLRAIEHEKMSSAVSRMRSRLAAQARACFGPEVSGRSPSDAADVIAMVDTFTSPEAYDVLTKAHARSRRQIARSWAIGLEALLAGWPEPARPDSTTRTRTDTA